MTVNEFLMSCNVNLPITSSGLIRLHSEVCHLLCNIPIYKRSLHEISYNLSEFCLSNSVEECIHVHSNINRTVMVVLLLMFIVEPNITTKSEIFYCKQTCTTYSNTCVHQSFSFIKML